jgi:hypothetical protein
MRISLVLVVFCVGCRVSPATPTVDDRPPTGLYWGRWSDVPDGVRVQVWMHGVGERTRGTWELPPWHGEFTGVRDATGTWAVTWREEAVVAAVTMRVRSSHLRRDRHGVLRGAFQDGALELAPAAMPDPRLRDGVWLARWTGLPHGMAVETVLTHTPDGRWRAAYRYQEREGTFEGQIGARGALAIRWREVSTAGRIAQGSGVLHPTATGMLGTYGVGDRDEGTGFWSLEPLHGE